MQVSFVEDFAEKEATESLERLKQAMRLRAECKVRHIEQLNSNESLLATHMANRALCDEVLRFERENAALRKEIDLLTNAQNANERKILQQALQNRTLEDTILDLNIELQACLEANQVERANLRQQNQQLNVLVQRLQAQLNGEMDAGSSTSSTSAGGVGG